MKKTLKLDWPILPGSISTAKSCCGKARCACKLSRPRLHGTYYRWTGFIGGKRTTKTVSKETAQECQRRIRRYRRFQRDLMTLLREAVAEAPWTLRSPLPRKTSKRS